MPIIHLGTSADRDKPNFQTYLLAQDYHFWDKETGRYGAVLLGPNVYFTYESHHGLCIKDFERNGYDDSDWFMVVWNPEKGAPETIEFASTRGWSYPCYGSRPDATPETLAAYAAHEADKEAKRVAAERRAKAKSHLATRAASLDVARAYGVPHYRLMRLRKTMGYRKLNDILALFGKSIRSPFKLRLREQVILWAGQESPQYEMPLSAKQMACIETTQRW